MLINVDDDADADDDGDVVDDDDERKMMMLMCRRRKMMMLRRRMLRRKTDPKTGKHTLCEPAQATCAWTLHKSHFVLKLTGKISGDTSGDIVLCEPAQSKCTWTFHKSHVVWKFIWNMPNAPDTTSIEHRALTPTVRTPQCGHTVWGTIANSWFWSGFRNPLVTSSSIASSLHGSHLAGAEVSFSGCIRACGRSRGTQWNSLLSNYSYHDQ